MENQKSNHWLQKAQSDDPKVREGESTLNEVNRDNEQREMPNERRQDNRGSGDYGAEGGRESSAQIHQNPQSENKPELPFASKENEPTNDNKNR